MDENKKCCICQELWEMMEDGRAEGMKIGIKKGEQRAFNLSTALVKKNRLEDLRRVIDDVQYRKPLYQELHA